MKIQTLLVSASLALGVALAQTPPAQDAQQKPAQSDQKMSDQKMNANAASTSTALPEMKTTSFKGVLVDMSCASQSECNVTSNSSQFGLKMDDGKTVKFDLVGNQRAQDAVKNQKSWSKDLGANKPIHAKVSGVLNGDKLIVSSIH